VFLSLLAASGGSIAAETSSSSGPRRASGAEGPPAPSLQWQAKLAELDPGARVLVLSGDVTIRLPRVALEAQRVEARYERGADLRSLSGGEVKLHLGDTQATAAAFQLDVRQQLLTLTGPVRLALGAGWTNAEQAEIDTRSGRITLHRVSGSLAIGADAPRTVASP
jgi:lipopolysaccharide export system protein LptA